MHHPISLFLVLLTVTLAGAPRAEASPPARRAVSATAPHRDRGGRAVETKSEPIANAETRAAEAKGKAGEKAAEAKGKAGEKATEAKVPAHSVGHPNEGRLEGGIRLDTSRKEIRVVPVYAAEDVRWGMPALVHMIERAARGVARRYPGAVLDVGDISRRAGGEVHRHHSHESGRDADIGLYAVDAKGKQVHARGFIQFDARLGARNVPGARFDVARTWLLVQHMLTDPEARVSHIFIAEPLKHALLAEAKRRGVSRAVLTRAQLAMMQPTGVEPHDDHMHVRVSCPRASGGCIELAKNAPTGRDRARAARVTKGERTLRDPGRATPPRAAGARAGTRPDASARPRREARQARDARQNAAARQARDARLAAVARQARDARPEVIAPPATAPAATPIDEDAAPPAARGAEQAPMRFDAFDLAILRAPAISGTEAEADEDGAEVKDAIDDGGR